MIICAIMLAFSLALVGVAYATGGSFSRLSATTDIFDMTKFISRAELESYVNRGFEIVNRFLP